MKLNELFIALLLLVAVNVAHAEDPTPEPVFTNGGTIHFKGEMVNAACVVSTQSANQTVNLGQYRTASFQSTGATSEKVPFEIVLNDCDPTVSTNTSITFSGQANVTNSDLLSIVNSDNTATNVGIEILDHADTVLPPNGAEYSTAQALVNGNNILRFNARYKSTAVAVTPGLANADATFIVKYD